MEHVQMDIFYGPEDTSSIETYLIIIDVKTRYAWVKQVTDVSRSTITGSFRGAMIQLQFKPKIVTTDGGGCFTGHEYTTFNHS